MAKQQSRKGSKQKPVDPKDDAGTAKEPAYETPAPVPVETPVAKKEVSLKDVVFDVFSDAQESTKQNIVDNLYSVKVESLDELISTDINVVNASIRMAFMEAAKLIQALVAEGEWRDSELEQKIIDVAEGRKIAPDSLFVRRGAFDLGAILQQISGNHDGFSLVGGIPKENGGS